MLDSKRPIRTFEALKPSFLRSLPLPVNPKRPTCQRTKVIRSVIEGKESKPPKSSVVDEVRGLVTHTVKLKLEDARGLRHLCFMVSGTGILA